MSQLASLKKLGIPNWLSILRLILIPVFIIVFFQPSPNAGVIAAIILAISGITDILDGIIARHFNLITDLGKILDPLADKMTQATVCICLVIAQAAPWWLFAVLVAELLMIVGGAKLLKNGQKITGSKWYGKLGTAIFYALMLSIIVFRPNQRITTILVSIILIFMLFSFIMYIPVFLKLHAKNNHKTKR